MWVANLTSPVTNRIPPLGPLGIQAAFMLVEFDGAEKVTFAGEAGEIVDDVALLLLHMSVESLTTVVSGVKISRSCY